MGLHTLDNNPPPTVVDTLKRRKKVLAHINLKKVISFPSEAVLWWYTLTLYQIIICPSRQTMTPRSMEFVTHVRWVPWLCPFGGRGGAEPCRNISSRTWEISKRIVWVISYKVLFESRWNCIMRYSNTLAMLFGGYTPWRNFPRVRGRWGFLVQDFKEI